jgi:rSAM/selenodomain-associated transferase 2
VAVVVPALNEAAPLPATLAPLLAEADVVVVADGGSSDDTADTARALGAHLVADASGRGAQMNAGARSTDAEILVFVHADTLLPAGWAADVREVLSDPTVSLGAFTFATDSPRVSMAIVELLVALRCAIAHTPYGDQAYFLRRDTFDALGGFKEMPLLEDFEFVRRAKRLGRVRTLKGRRAITSARMWERLGVVRAWWRNWRTAMGYRLGVDPQTLAAWRRR